MFTYPFVVRIFRGYGYLPGDYHLVRLHDSFEFEIRCITRAEYALWQRQFPKQHDFDDQVLRTAVLAHPAEFMGKPWDWDEVYFGVPYQVLEKIYSLSGYGSAPDPDLMALANAYINSPEARSDLVIMTAYPAYKLQDLEDLDPLDYYKLLANAQLKLAIMEIDSEAILNPEEAAKKRKRQQLTGSAMDHLPGGSKGAVPLSQFPRSGDTVKQHEQPPMTFTAD